MKKVNREDVVLALNALPNDKSPGNGFPAFSKTPGLLLMMSVQQFYNSFRMVTSESHELTNPTFFKDFSPIASSTTLYKLISKIITTQLKIVVDYIVGPSQSALIEGRKILVNAIMTHELVNEYDQKGV